jgi:hypothetical protein
MAITEAHWEDSQMTSTVLEPAESANVSTDALDARIVARVNEDAVIGLDALVQALPEYSWNQIFSTVDQLARAGRIVLRRHRYDYALFSTAYPA